MIMLDFSEIEMQEIWRILAIVLHLGNLEFSVVSAAVSPSGHADGAATISNSRRCQRALNAAAELLGIDPIILSNALVKRFLSTHGSTVSISLDVPAALENTKPYQRKSVPKPLTGSWNS